MTAVKGFIFPKDVEPIWFLGEQRSAEGGVGEGLGGGETVRMQPCKPHRCHRKVTFVMVALTKKEHIHTQKKKKKKKKKKRTKIDISVSLRPFIWHIPVRPRLSDFLPLCVLVS